MHVSCAQVRKVRKIGDGKAIGGFAGVHLHNLHLHKLGRALWRAHRLTI